MPDDSSKPKISPTLDENPRENLAKWLDSVHAAARHYCASHGANGALHLAASAEFWLAVNGGAVVARPVHPMPGPLAPAAGPAERINHLAEVELAKDMADAAATLRQLVIASLGPTELEHVTDPVLGLHNATANNLITAMVARHGEFTEADLDGFFVRLDIKLKALDSYDAHASEFNRVLRLINQVGVRLDGFPAHRRFLDALSNFPAFGPHVASFVQLFPGVNTRTVAGIVPHLRLHVPSVAALSTGNPFAGAAQGSSASDEALLATYRPVFTVGQWAGLTRSELVMALTAQGPGNNNRRNNANVANTGNRTNNTADATPAGFFYCYKHGHNKTHGWNPTDGSLKEPCNYMKDRPTEFTRAQRAAKTCTECAGGCKYVQKKVCIVLASMSDSKLTPSLSPLPSSNRKPQYDNPFVSLVDPPPPPLPIHPRDANDKPIATPVPFSPPLSAPVYLKPRLTTKAKVGTTLFDVKGKPTTWAAVAATQARSLPVSQLSTVYAHDDIDMTAAAQCDAQPDHQHDMCLESDAHNLNIHKCANTTTPPHPKKILDPVALSLDDFPNHLTLPVPNHAHLLNIRNVADAVFVLKHHRAFGSPTLPTFLQAIRKKWIDIPGLTGKIVSQNPPLSIATAQGHLDLVRQGLRSTSPKKPTSPPS